MNEPEVTQEEETQPSPEIQNSSSHGFRVEIRYVGYGAFVIGDTVIGKDWVRLPTVKEVQQSVGIDRGGNVRNGAAASGDSLYDAITDTHSYMGAIALAASSLSHGPLGLEARLIEYQRVIDVKVTQTDTLVFPDNFDVMCAFAESRRKKAKQS